MQKMVDLSVVYSKTAKGLRARTSLIGGLSSQLMKVLTHIDGKSEAETILSKFIQLSEQELASALAQLESEGYIKPIAVRTADDWAPTSNFTPMIVEEFLDEDEVETKARAMTEELARLDAERKAKAEKEARLEAERKAKEAEEKAKLEAEQARAKAKEKAEAKVKAQLEIERIAREAEEKAKLEAEKARAKAEAEEKARIEAERKAKAAEEARLEAERKAKEAEEKAKLEAEKARAKAEAEAQENARREIERIAREAEEAQKKAEAEARAKAAEEARLEAERKAKAAEEALLEAERIAKAEKEARLEVERKAQQEVEQARAKAEAEEKARIEAEEKARREIERIAREAEVARKKAEADARSKAKEAERLEKERKAKAEEDARLEAERIREAEEKAKLEADQARAKAEAEERAKIEAEENTRLEMKRIIREAEEERKKSEAMAKAARQEAKRKAKAEEDARLKAERRAQQEAEQMRHEAIAEEKAIAEAKENVRLEMERISQEAQKEREISKTEALAKDADQAKLEIENKAKIEQESEQALKAEADMEINAEAQVKAHLEAKSMAREAEAARIQFEDDDRALSEEDLRELAEEEAEYEAKRTNKAEVVDLVEPEVEEKARQDAENLAREEVKRIAKEEAKAEARLKAQAKTQAMLMVATTSAKKWIKRGTKATLVGLPILILLFIVLLPYINLGMLVDPIEKLASESTGEPVTVKDVHASLWPEPNLVIGDVTVGANASHNIQAVHILLDASTLFEQVKVVKSLEIEGLKIERENFGQSLQWISRTGKAERLKIGQINLKNLSLKIRDLEIGPFEGRVGRTESNELSNIELNSTDHALSVQILPQGGTYEVVLTAANWPLPVNPKIVFDTLKARGVLNQNQINFSQFKGEIYGGSLMANVLVDWSNQWSASGSFNLTKANVLEMLKAFNSAASVDGKLDLAGNFACKSVVAAKLTDTPDITANFDIGNGSLNDVELTRAVLSRESQSLAGESTHFDKLSGSLQTKSGIYQYRKLTLDSDQFHAKGNFDVQPNQDISGKISANLAAQSRRLYANFGLTGKINDVKRQ